MHPVLLSPPLLDLTRPMTQEHALAFARVYMRRNWQALSLCFSGDIVPTDGMRDPLDCGVELRLPARERQAPVHLRPTLQCRPPDVQTPSVARLGGDVSPHLDVFIVTPLQYGHDAGRQHSSGQHFGHLWEVMPVQGHARETRCFSRASVPAFFSCPSRVNGVSMALHCSIPHSDTSVLRCFGSRSSSTPPSTHGPVCSRTSLPNPPSRTRPSSRTASYKHSKFLEGLVHKKSSTCSTTNKSSPL